MIRGLAPGLLAALALAGACSRGTPPGGASDPSSTPVPRNAPETRKNIVQEANPGDDAPAPVPPEEPPEEPTVDALAAATTTGAASNGSLAHTGTGVSGPVLAGVMLIACGAMVLAARRREHRFA